MELHLHWRSQAQGLVIDYLIPIKARATRSSEPPLQVDSGGNAEDPPHTLVENPDAQWQEDNVLLHPM